MSGARSDIVGRLRALLPSRWFSDDAPVLDAMLTGFASTWSWIRDSTSQAQSQLRITTASDTWLDLMALDYFGRSLRRRRRESDGRFSTRIRAELLRERGTRRAMRLALLDLTGREPAIFEPASPRDTGGYGSAGGASSGCGYNIAGGWGSLSLPFQCFITAYRPRGSGIAAVSGWTCQNGAYGQGEIEYANLALMESLVSDADILDSIARTMPAATIAWARITN